MDSSQHNSAAGSVGGNGIINPKSNDASPADFAANAAASAAGSPAEESKQNLNQVINSIDKTLGILHQLYLTVSSYNVSSQLPLLQHMNNLVLELDNMEKLGKKCNIQVPMEVLNLIDDGNNPDEFTRDVLNSCIAKNQITKGKTDAFKGQVTYLIIFLVARLIVKILSFWVCDGISWRSLNRLSPRKWKLIGRFMLLLQLRQNVWLKRKVYCQMEM